MQHLAAARFYRLEVSEAGRALHPERVGAVHVRERHLGEGEGEGEGER